jgi:hypothetical protein
MKKAAQVEEAPSPLRDIAAEVATIKALLAQSPAAIPKKAREALDRIEQLATGN